MAHYEYAVSPISSLKKYKNNSRTHSQEQIKQVELSINEFGFTNPILIDDKGEIIAGHCRVIAASNIGMTEVPCIVLTELTKAHHK